MNTNSSEKNKPKIAFGVIILGMLFAIVLIASNVTGAKLVDFFIFKYRLTISVALLFFPLTYVISDITTEVYGFKICRLLIWTGLICNVLFMLMLFVATTIKPSIYFEGQAAFRSTLMTSCRIFTASVISFFVAEFINSILISKLKVKLAGRFLPLRIISSTFAGIVFGSLLFYEIAFIYVEPQWLIIEMMFIEFLVKIIYDLCCLPLTCFFCRKLKKIDGIDHYDYNIKYNPFKFWQK